MIGTWLKLSVMMFLEFFIWGAWYPLVFGYLPSLGFNADWQQPVILGTFNVAALVALFFSTQFVDRNFAAEKFLAFSMLVAGLAMLGLFLVRGGWTYSVLGIRIDLSFWAFFGLMLVHCLFYVPTISITNSIAFANLRADYFGMVRLFGTIGWIAASVPMSFVLIDWSAVREANPQGTVNWLKAILDTPLKGEALLEATSYIFVAGGLAALVLAGFSLALPHTPPKPATAGRESLAWLEAMKLLRFPFILVLFIVTFFDSAVHQCFFFWTGRYLEIGVGISRAWVMPIMSIGQFAEILTLLFLAYVLKLLGWRTTMIIGILGHAARFAVFAFYPDPIGDYLPWLGVSPPIVINILHGICYAFFFATVYIFIDEYFPKDARASAQGLFNVLILGVGPFVGNFLCARLGTRYTDEAGNINFQSIFLYPCAAALFAAALLLLLFHPPRKADTGKEGSVLPGDEGEKWTTTPSEGVMAPAGQVQSGR
jgi:MFS family permease